MILDLDGDPVTGPLTLQMKLYPVGEDEPDEYLATWKQDVGLGVSDDEELDHGFLAAAIGANS